MNGEYADIMVDGKFTSEFIDEAFKQMENSFNLLYANRIYFGVDKPLSASTTGHYKGLKDLISIAKSSTAIESVDNIVLIGGAGKATNIDLSDTSISDLNAFSQLNNLLFKVSNVNDCFTVGLDASDTTR
jgi:purine-nucleoside phosphorylase